MIVIVISNIGFMITKQVIKNFQSKSINLNSLVIADEEKRIKKYILILVLFLINLQHMRSLIIVITLYQMENIYILHI